MFEVGSGNSSVRDVEIASQVYGSNDSGGKRSDRDDIRVQKEMVVNLVNPEIVNLVRL